MKILYDHNFACSPIHSIFLPTSHSAVSPNGWETKNKVIIQKCPLKVLTLGYRIFLSLNHLLQWAALFPFSLWPHNSMLGRLIPWTVTWWAWSTHEANNLFPTWEPWAIQIHETNWSSSWSPKFEEVQYETWILYMFCMFFSSSFPDPFQVMGIPPPSSPPLASSRMHEMLIIVEN